MSGKPDLPAIKARLAAATATVDELRRHAGLMRRTETPGVLWRGAETVDGMTGDLAALVAEVERLRGLISEADHDESCARRTHNPKYDGEMRSIADGDFEDWPVCDCWKSKAVLDAG